MTISDIAHDPLALPAGRAEEARDLCARRLWVPGVAKPAELARRGGAWFESGKVKIHLGVAVVEDEPLRGYERA